MTTDHVQSSLMPAAFLGHGSPMNAIEKNRYTRPGGAFGASSAASARNLGRSAHWYVDVTAVTAMARPRTIHDFYGFPQPLFDVEYPAPRDPKLAEEVTEIAKPTHVGLDPDGWGLDHGTWSVLVHAFPKADIPVVQLSIDARKRFEDHFDLGARLAPLRASGVLIVGSGNIVHNLGAMTGDRDVGFDWAHGSTTPRRRVVIGPDRSLRLDGHGDFRGPCRHRTTSSPCSTSPGWPKVAADEIDILADGYAYGSLSMTSYTLGLAHCGDSDIVRCEPPPPPSLPPDESNI